jgi:hypothetical protein
MNKYLLFVVFLFGLFTASAQNCADSERYQVDLGSNVERVQVDFATVRDYTNQNRVLRAHVYQLSGDTVSNRPLIVLAHGGAFIFGNKNDMRQQCEEYARRGYVCASIDYRLYPILLGLPDSAKVVEIAFNAISDMRASVRHFRADADRGNTYRIDPNKIIVGGLSAGAIMALHVGILNEGDDISQEFLDFLNSRGGIEGNVGDSINLSYSSRVSGIINLSGALFDLAWLDESDPVIMSMHGDSDNTVPFGTAREGAFNRVTVHGSSVIDARARQIGITSYFLPVPGGGHTDIYGAAFSSFNTEFRTETTRIKRDLVCDEPTSAHFTNYTKIELKVYPNPASEEIFVASNVRFSGRYTLSDMLGRPVASGMINNEQDIQINRPGLDGIYLLSIHTTDSQILQRKVIFSK